MSHGVTARGVFLKIAGTADSLQGLRSARVFRELTKVR